MTDAVDPAEPWDGVTLVDVVICAVDCACVEPTVEASEEVVEKC